MALTNPIPPPVRRPRLAEAIIETLRDRIGSGEIAPGDKLPTESQLTADFGVSRTVVREAIAALTADGLVQPRQGAGVFVLGSSNSRFGVIAGERSGKISVALNVLEVRIGIEIESAGLAAQRRSISQDAAIQETWQAFGQLLEDRSPTGKADFAFHRAIAAATNNPLYVELLDALGSRTIPCDVASPWATDSELTYDYLLSLHQEHLDILKAISARDADGARAAMRHHLSRSQDRYRNRVAEQVRTRLR